MLQCFGRELLFGSARGGEGRTGLQVHRGSAPGGRDEDQVTTKRSTYNFFFFSSCLFALRDDHDRNVEWQKSTESMRSTSPCHRRGICTSYSYSPAAQSVARSPLCTPWPSTTDRASTSLKTYGGPFSTKKMRRSD